MAAMLRMKKIEIDELERGGRGLRTSSRGGPGRPRLFLSG
jgi:hypothetical protein